ncbi:MAG: hypothetical protein K9J06_13265 [Flavobacteriales bacterium]|nr:hypothetical protein [Flavobacteriales bacterium]
MRLLLSIAFTLILLCPALGQQNVLTAGLQFQPIFPVSFLNTADQEVRNSQGTVTTLLSPKFSFSAGMVVRWGFHKRLSLETGINFVQRNYDVTLSTDTFSGTSDFTIIGYEHPIKLLVFVRLADKLFMNAAGGVQLTFFPSDIFTSDTYFRHSGLRLGVGQFLHGGGIANLGLEYRTKGAGYFYLGATYHVGFGDIYRSKFQYVSDDVQSEAMPIWLNGSYLTFDVRYFFHSMPLERKEGKKKKKSRKQKLNDAEQAD